VRAAVHDVVRGTRLVFLSEARVTELCPGVAIVGHDGWADGRNGDYTGSTFRPNDFVHNQDFQVFDHREQRLRLMQDLAARAATHFAEVLPQAAATYSHVVALTHVPPFAAAARYRGRPATADVQPFYSSRCVGEVILETMAHHPSCRLTVLAGHTHAAARFNAAPNVQVRTASATYGRPRIAAWLDANGSGVR
jgi:hypothetical protein